MNMDELRQMFGPEEIALIEEVLNSDMPPGVNSVRYRITKIPPAQPILTQTKEKITIHKMQGGKTSTYQTERLDTNTNVPKDYGSITITQIPIDQFGNQIGDGIVLRTIPIPPPPGESTTVSEQKTTMYESEPNVPLLQSEQHLYNQQIVDQQYPPMLPPPTVDQQGYQTNIVNQQYQEQIMNQQQPQVY